MTEVREYVDTELSSLRSRVKQLAISVDTIDRTVKAKDAHLVSNAYHMSSVEANTANNLNEVKSRISNLESQFNQLSRDVATINSMLTVIRQDQARLLSTQSEDSRKTGGKLSELASKLESEKKLKHLDGDRKIDDCLHKINVLETSLNSKFDGVSLKLTTQLSNLERSFADQQRNVQDLIEAKLERSENKMKNKFTEHTTQSQAQNHKLLETVTNQDDSIDFLIEKLKNHEKKTGDRLRSLNDDYRSDMKVLTDSINAVQELVTSKMKLTREEMQAEISNLKRLVTLS